MSTTRELLCRTTCIQNASRSPLSKRLFSSAAAARSSSSSSSSSSNCGIKLNSNKSSIYLNRSPRTRSLHASCSLSSPRKRDFFSSNINRQQQEPSRQKQQQQESRPGPRHEAETGEAQSSQRLKKPSRIPASKTSLRRVAVEAQRSRDGISSRRGVGVGGAESRTKRVTAYCAAEQYNIPRVVSILQAKGYECDPCTTGLYPQVVHIEVPLHSNENQVGTDIGWTEGVGDVFIFPSGTVVAWSLPDDVALRLVTQTLLPAAENPHLDLLETEDLEYLEDPQRENSKMDGDTIILGTKLQTAASPPIESEDASTTTTFAAPASTDTASGRVDTVLAEIAFSSGLARSTKLAVLESLLSNYFSSTRSIPTMLSRGSRLPFTRSFILMKTGQLLSVRAQLNLYSELTDSLPDIFWDSRHELGLEGYYDQVGRALDVGVRIKVLNEKMDYAQEIASVLRERLSEKHGLVLEWMIIALITVEVGFEIMRLWKERKERLEKEARATSGESKKSLAGGDGGKCCCHEH
ncbi:MAG: hypothetical protein M1819_000550 [Sarea resinae]|nr:MAG: hypothetical protein M1819_000550 [Sarea resinae]